MFSIHTIVNEWTTKVKLCLTNISKHCFAYNISILLYKAYFFCFFFQSILLITHCHLLLFFLYANDDEYVFCSKEFTSHQIDLSRPYINFSRNINIYSDEIIKWSKKCENSFHFWKSHQHHHKSYYCSTMLRIYLIQWKRIASSIFCLFIQSFFIHKT